MLRSGRRLRGCDDAELVRCLRAGDDAAFEVAYDRHHRGILSFCRHMLGSREEAEDAVQHTFIAAYRDLVGSDKPIQLKAWLYAIARNRCLSVLRARREQVAIDDVEPATEGLSSEVQRREDLRDLLGDLARLPEDQRAALILSELGALSHHEIAVTLEVRKDKVKALVFQARESLSASRRAREADCQEIREQLAVLRGGALRRSAIRRHLDVCAGCRDFRDEVHRQRAAMAVLLPVAPSVALKGAVISGGAAAAGAATASSGGLMAALGAQSLTAKALVTVVIAGGAAGATLLGGDDVATPPAVAAPSDPKQVVETLRERADRVSEQRERDARADNAVPAAKPKRDAEPARRARRARTQPAAPDTGAAGRAVVPVPRPAPRRTDPPVDAERTLPPQPPVPPSTPVAPTPPPAAETPGESGPRVKGPKVKKPKSRGRKHRGRRQHPVFPVPLPVGPRDKDDDERPGGDDDRDDRDDDRHDRGRRDADGVVRYALGDRERPAETE